LSREPKRSAPHPRDGQTEQKILDAAHAVFVRSGTAGARTQEIAREAGVNSALLHYYFRTKERLAQAVFTRAAGQLLPAVIRILASDAELEDKVDQVVQTELQHLSKAPYLPGYILSELAHHPERAGQLVSAVTGMVPAEIGMRVGGALRAQLDARVRAGSIHPIEPDQFIVNLLAMCVFPFAARPMLMALLGFDQAGFERFIDRRRRELAPFFLRALRP
jgi:AcrR family transcriptional regulator